MPRLVFALLKWLAALAMFGNLVYLGVVLRKAWDEARHPEEAAPTSAEQVLPIAKDEKLSIKVRSTYFLTEPARACSWQERVAVHGRVVANPHATYEIRSPFAGTLLAGDRPWPQVGQSVKPGQVLARVSVRVSPQERLELQNKLAEAVYKEKGAKEVFDLRQTVVTRLEKASSPVVAQRELDEARVQLSEARTQLATAEAAVQLWRKALEDSDPMSEKPAEMWLRSLVTPSEANVGTLEIAELPAQPGAAIEAGGLVAKLVDASRILVRLDLPGDLAEQNPPREVQLFPSWKARSGPEVLNDAMPPLKAVFVGPASLVDVASQQTSYYYAVPNRQELVQRAWRPGSFVVTEWPVANGRVQDAISVPTSAVLYHQGRTLVYLKVKVPTEQYVRRIVDVLGIEGEQCIVAAKPPNFCPPNYGVEANDEVVVTYPQVLLASEFRRDADDD